METIKEFLKSKPSRRNFLAGAGAVGATALIAGCNDSSSSGPTTGQGPAPTYPALDFADNDILNFALNLEYLEAEFYLRAATGSGTLGCGRADRRGYGDGRSAGSRAFGCGADVCERACPDRVESRPCDSGDDYGKQRNTGSAAQH